MGPRLVSRGKVFAHFPALYVYLASMGPRLVSRGKQILAVLSRSYDATLQWGRDLLVAERMWFDRNFLPKRRFNGAATC